MLIISAGTSDFIPLMTECSRRARALGYDYSSRALAASDDLTPRAGVPPATFKPTVLREALASVPPGALVAWVDADAVIVRDLDSLDSLDFDLAVTFREAAEIGASGRPDTDDVNSGVVFARNTEWGRAFVAAWCAQVQRAGITGDQHALSHILREVCAFDGPERFKDYIGQLLPSYFGKILALPALEWNCWYFDRPEARQARILHFKSGFRQAGGPLWWQHTLKRLAA